MTAGPAIQPNWAMAHAKDSTPDPITAVIMWALAVQKVPNSYQTTKIRIFLFFSTKLDFFFFSLNLKY